MYDYKKLKVWRRAVDLYEEVLKITMGFPKFEVYALGDQMRRSAESISSNIAEGCGKRTRKDYISYLHNSIGSVKELENQLMLAFRNGYITVEKKNSLMKELDEIGKMLFGVIRFLNKKDAE
ncbi:MAG: four helix bundle protein [archaeon]